MSKEVQPRIPATWPIASGVVAHIVGLMSGTSDTAMTGLFIAGAGGAIAAGDFICDRVGDIKGRLKKKQEKQEDKPDQ